MLAETLLFEHELRRSLVKDQLTESHELQLNALAQLQVLLPRNEKFDELAGQNLLDAAHSVRIRARLEDATLADDRGLHA